MYPVGCQCAETSPQISVVLPKSLHISPDYRLIILVAWFGVSGGAGIICRGSARFPNLLVESEAGPSQLSVNA
ncbi:hypothetical protein SS1G_01829 [Sclerotinia sclerotiorum 1980 UF-70]|uniref:Uncharacterized protein n=1 Tax=Sclerotinia sclerotiorum (strain ATCC 18683 / 1980 / Ss-1) TaxID=665079 RepID=A7E949_SCLS1|nr:hypothetical protein SS1G_01829 [Sclerotinia sclerotiorum 1980 UF-70]EDN96901.1 hypothetical protein SS1G_01829 [Sclerotinia sclerotiorum 1980 UF-70]